MARQIIDTTTPQAGGKIGDTAKVAFEKTNDNFEELYDAVANIPEDTTGDIEALDVRVTANEGAISTLDGRVTANEGAISALDTRVTANEGEIGALRGYIDGLRMEWVSGTSLRISGGAAYIPGLQGILGVESPITKSGLSLSANTWHHVYLYRNNGAADIDVSTTAPGAPYSGTACTKSGDSARRYVGSVLTQGDGQIARFVHDGDSIRWADFYRALDTGRETVPTDVNLSAFVGPTAKSAFLRITNTVTLEGHEFLVGWHGALSHPIGAGQSAWMHMPTGSAQVVQYVFGSPPSQGGAYIDVFGYRLER